MSQDYIVGELPVLGSNLAFNTPDVPPGYARYIQDAFIDPDGSLRRRGPIQKRTSFDVSGISTSGDLRGMLYCYDPIQTLKFMSQNTTNSFRVWDSTGTKLADFTLNGAWITLLGAVPDFGASNFVVGINGEAIIGSGLQGTIALWRGGYTFTPAPGVTTLTSTLGSTTITASVATFTAGHVGDFVFINGNYVGVIKTISSTTVALLEEGAWMTVAANAAWFLSPIRGPYITPSPGRIQTQTTGTAITGSGTKFLELGTGSNTWSVHRALEAGSGVVGTITGASVTNNTSIALGANAAFALDLSKYRLVQQGGFYSTTGLNRTAANSVGFTPAVYAGRVWYGCNYLTQKNQSTVWFSDRDNSENVDLSPTTGSFIFVSTNQDTSRIVAMVGTPAGLVVFKKQYTYLITGTDPSSFAVTRLYNDGLISQQGFTAFKDGCAWAGYNGVYYFDGGGVTNLTEASMGDEYNRFVNTQDVTSPSYSSASFYCRMWTARDYLFLNFAPSDTNTTESPWTVFTREIYSPLMRSSSPTYYANSSSLWTSVNDELYVERDTREPLTMVINIPTRALTFFRNITCSGISAKVNGLIEGEENLLVAFDALTNLPFVFGTESMFKYSGLDVVDTCVNNIVYDTTLTPKEWKPAYWLTFFDTFTASTLNSNYTTSGNFSVSGGQLVPSDTAGFSLRLTPAWAITPYNALFMVFTTGTSLVGFQNRLRLYNADLSHYLEVNTTGTQLQITVDGVSKDTSVVALATSTKYSLWLGFAPDNKVVGHVVAGDASTSATIHPANIPLTVDYTLSGAEAEFFEGDTTGAGSGNPYFACDVGVTSERVDALCAIPYRYPSGPRFYLDTGVKAVPDVNEKWTKSLEIMYASALGSLQVLVSNGLESAIPTAEDFLSRTTSIIEWKNANTSWKYTNFQLRNWVSMLQLRPGTAQGDLVNSNGFTAWDHARINIGNTNLGLGVIIAQNHTAVGDVRIKSWQFGFRPLRNGRVSS